MERTADPQIMIFSFDDDGSRSRNARRTPGNSGAVEANSGNSSSTSSSGSSSAWLAMCSSASSQSRRMFTPDVGLSLEERVYSPSSA